MYNILYITEKLFEIIWERSMIIKNFHYKLNKIFRFIYDPSNKCIFDRQIRNGDTCQVKHARFHGTSCQSLHTFSYLNDLNSDWFSSFSLFVSPVLQVLCGSFREFLGFFLFFPPAVLILSLRFAAVSFLPFLRLFPFTSFSFSFFFLCWYKHLHFLPRLYFYFIIPICLFLRRDSHSIHTCIFFKTANE